MTYFQDNSLGKIEHALGTISEYQRVISNNIANVQTPGYRAQKMNFADVLSAQNNPFETSLSRRMGSSRVDIATTGQPVDLQHEMIEMQKNNLYYNMATRWAATYFRNLRTASQIGR
ncbi:MAG: flagellar basal body rod protein FlgB [Candidatus Melainabacteria bacterium]